eukprot:s1317_g14.t2
MVRVAREAVAAEGRVVSPNSGWREPPRQEVRQMTGAGSTSSFMPRLGEALCCDVTLALPLHADGRPQPASLDRDTAAQTTTLPGTCHPQRLVVLAAEVVWAARLRVAARLGDDAVWCAPSQPIGDEHIPLGQIVVLTEAEQPSRPVSRKLSRKMSDPNPNAPPFIPGTSWGGLHQTPDLNPHLHHEDAVATLSRGPPGWVAARASRRSNLAMGSVESVADAVSSCTQISDRIQKGFNFFIDSAECSPESRIPSLSKEEIRPPWALAQADKFDYEDCPFCDLRRHHCVWLRSEIKRLKSEVAAVQTTIPPRLYPELRQQLEAEPLPPSGYTGGVDDISASSCPRCPEHRQEVLDLQAEANKWDAECKAQSQVRAREGSEEDVPERSKTCSLKLGMLQSTGPEEKRQIEARLFSTGTGTAMDDGHFFAITRVNLADEDVMTTAAARPLLYWAITTVAYTSLFLHCGLVTSAYSRPAPPTEPPPMPPSGAPPLPGVSFGLGQLGPSMGPVPNRGLAPQPVGGRQPCGCQAIGAGAIGAGPIGAGTIGGAIAPPMAPHSVDAWEESGPIRAKPAPSHTTGPSTSDDKEHRVLKVLGFCTLGFHPRPGKKRCRKLCTYCELQKR